MEGFHHGEIGNLRLYGLDIFNQCTQRSIHKTPLEHLSRIFHSLPPQSKSDMIIIYNTV